MEGCEFRDHAADYEAKNAIILGASFDTPAENEAFAKKFDFNFPLLCDTDRKLGLAYGAAESSESTHASRIGVVIGPDGMIKDYQPKADAKTYPTDALQRL